MLGAGVAGWLAGAVAYLAWFFSSATDTGLGAVAAPFVAFAVGYLPGGGVLVLYAAVQLVRGRLAPVVAGAALLVYVLPVVLYVLASRVLLAVVPWTTAEGDLGTMMGSLGGPLLALLYLAGLGLGVGLRDRPLGVTVAGFLGPPLVGGAALVGWLLVTTLTSAEFRHRDAFAFTVGEAAVTEEGLVVDATLEVRRAGRWDFRAIYLEVAGGSSGGHAEIEWADAVPPAAPGTHRLRLRFRDLRPAPRVESRTVHFEIRARGPDGGYEAPVREFRVPVEPRGLPASGDRRP